MVEHQTHVADPHSAHPFDVAGRRLSWPQAAGEATDPSRDPVADGAFTRRGRHADLASSQRAQRRLVFRPVEHPPTERLPIPLREALSLDVPETGKLRLERTLTDGSGLASTVTAEGQDSDRLLEWIEAVPVQRQFRLHGGIPVARSYLIELTGDATDGSDVSARAVIIGARARIAGLNLELKADRFIRHAAELRLTADPGTKLMIPEDLIAVAGWHWRPLREFVDFWRGGIHVKSSEPEHTADIEAKLGRTVTHLAQTLARPPACFHEAHRRARWRVTLQRAIPLSTGLAILALTPTVQWLDLDDGSILRMLIFHAPPIMLAGIFMLKELPRIEIPPLPRPLKNHAWLSQAADKRADPASRPHAAETADS